LMMVMMIGRSTIGRLGNGDVSTSRAKGISAAMKHFHAFLQKQNLASVESVVCSVDVFQDCLLSSA